MKPIRFLFCLALALAAFSCDPTYDEGLAPTAYIGYDEVPVNGEQYNEIVENPFVLVSEEPVSTFSIDADGASYSNARRMIFSNMFPPADAIRTEELVNYFTYDYGQVAGPHPIGLNGEVSDCPWAEGHKLIRIGIKGKDIPRAELPASNMVLLIDVSGSMSSGNKLGLLKESFKLFVDQLTAQDRLAIVTYAGQAGLVLPSTPGDQKATIKEAIDKLGAGGSTAGAAGIITAYEIAEDNLIPGGNNRVVLGTDGDFNVGPSSQEELVSLIEEKREKGVFLTILGVGSGNLNDAALEQLANNGNGNYEYLDNPRQAEKVFLHEYSKFFTVAKDVKVQARFNPILVHSYRLIGYENRLLENEDFEDDTKDAGEIGAGQTITALYEILPAEGGSSLQVPTFSIDFRYKLPEGEESIPLELDILDPDTRFEAASENMRFAAAVASFGLLLRDSDYKGDATYEDVIEWASGASGFDPHGLRQEFRLLAARAESL